MGLDSVELLIEFETYFGQEIPDSIAEKLETVDQVANYFSSRIRFSATPINLKADLFVKLQSFHSEMGWQLSNFQWETSIASFLSYDDLPSWEKLERLSALQLPRPRSKNKFIHAIGQLLPGRFHFEECSVSRFIDLVAAVNYNDLLKKEELHNDWEVLVAVMGITISLCGLNPYEISPEKSFTKDLGID